MIPASHVEERRQRLVGISLTCRFLLFGIGSTWMYSSPTGGQQDSLLNVSQPVPQAVIFGR